MFEANTRSNVAQKRAKAFGFEKALDKGVLMKQKAVLLSERIGRELEKRRSILEHLTSEYNQLHESTFSIKQQIESERLALFKETNDQAIQDFIKVHLLRSIKSDKLGMSN